MAHDVFISYSNIDKTKAVTICSILEQNGLSCWMAPRDITPGVDFAEAIIDGIRSSKAFVLVYTSNSNNSAQVIREVDRAVHHQLQIINIRLEEVPLSKQLDYYLSSVHWLDAMSSPPEEIAARLCGIVKTLLQTSDIKDKVTEQTISNGIQRLGKYQDSSAMGKRKGVVIKTVLSSGILLAMLIVLMVFKPGLFSKELKSIAVLPFTSLGQDSDQEYFIEGMYDEILDRIFKIGDIKVISRTSSMRYRNSDLSLKQIARELGVTNIVEGSVRKLGNNIKITVQLIDARSDTHLWSEIYDRKISDVFSIQSEIAQSIAREMKAVITPEEKTLIEKPRTLNNDAYEAYLKGMFSWRKLTKTDLDIAMQYFELALKNDAEFALAYAGIAHVWTARRQFSITEPRMATAKADDFINKAIELDTSSAEIYYIMATHLVWGKYDWKRGEAAFRKAIQINPNHAEAHAYYAHLLDILDRQEEAEIQIHNALELDPYSSLIRGLYAAWLGHIGRFEEALSEAMKAKELDPAQPVAPLNYFLYVLGREEEAFREFKKLFREPEFLAEIDAGFAEGGYKGAQKRVADLRALKSKSSYISPATIANNYAIAGDFENALLWLEKAFDEKNSALPYIHKRIWFTELNKDPRFRVLLQKMNLPFER